MSDRKDDEKLRVLDPDTDTTQESALAEVVVLEAVENDDRPVEMQAYAMGKVGRFFAKLLPFLTKECPLGAKHWKWERLCICGFGQVSADPDLVWHGGVCDMKAEVELQPCAHCAPDLSIHHHQWALTYEEEALIVAWRDYREQYLSHFGEQAPYRYEVSVMLNNTVKAPLMAHSQGLQQLSSGQNFAFFVPPAPVDDKPN